MSYPSYGDLSNAMNTNAQMKELLERWLAQCKMGLGDGLPQQIWPSGETITPTSAFVNLHGSDATVSWITTSGIENGFMLFLKSGEASSSFTIKHNTSGVGRINTTDGEDLVLSSLNEGLLLLKWGNVWTEMFRFPTANGSQLITSSGTFTVPIGVRKIVAFAVGGGGGGGGGFPGDIERPGFTYPGGFVHPVNGSNGGTTTVTIGAQTVSASGGVGGYGGAGAKGGDGSSPGQGGTYDTPFSGLGGYPVIPFVGIYGRGGRGGDGGYSRNNSTPDTYVCPGGGGAGWPGMLASGTLSVRSRDTLTITIGSGGIGGSGGDSGNVIKTWRGGDAYNGQNGCVLLVW